LRAAVNDSTALRMISSASSPTNSPLCFKMRTVDYHGVDIKRISLLHQQERRIDEGSDIQVVRSH